MFKALFAKKDHFGGYLPEAVDMPSIYQAHPEYEPGSPESGYPQTGERGGADLTDAEYRDLRLYEHRAFPEVWYKMRDEFAVMNKDEFARFRAAAAESAFTAYADDEETPEEEHAAILALREDLKAEEGATDEELDEYLPLPVLPA